MLDKLIKDYRQGLMSEDDFLTESFQYHKELENYTHLLRGGYVKRIEISPEGVFLQIQINEESFYLRLNQGDVCDIPALVLNFGEFETQEQNMVMKIASYLGKGSVFFDVGANLGWYSLILHSSASDYICYSFEPVKETFDKMMCNFRRNGFDTSRCYNFGFYKESTDMDFYFNTEESGASSLANLRENEGTIKVVCKMKAMDDFVEEEGIDRLDFIKCDVEGSELFVYQGGRETIEKYKPVVFSEMLRKWCRKFEYHPNDIIAMFRSMGYECFVITADDHLVGIEKVTEETVETNYFFLHREKHKTIIKELVEGTEA